MRLIRNADPDKRNECFRLTIAKAPLSIAEKVLLEAAVEQGKWPVHPERIKAPEAQFVSDSGVFDAALTNWSARVRECVELGKIAKEPRMHSILYRFAQLNFAYSETYEAVTKICSSDDGLRVFLSIHIKNSQFDGVDMYGLVEDAQALADRINASVLMHEYSWLATQLTTTELATAIKDQSVRLKGLARTGQGNPV